MTKKDLIIESARKAGVTQKASAAVIDAYWATITEQLRANQPVVIDKVGKFIVKDRPAHQGRNPFTGETIPIPAGKGVAFRLSAYFKKTV